jgi:uncharacterized membrane-anchored protein
MTAATALIAAAPWRDDDLALSGTAIQLQMWPADPRTLRVS